LKNEVKRALATLSEREAQVIKLYFGLDSEHSLTLEEIGEKFNLTRERVGRLRKSNSPIAACVAKQSIACISWIKEKNLLTREQYFGYCP